MLRLGANTQAAAGSEVTVIYNVRDETPQNLSSMFHSSIKLVNVQMVSLKEKLFSLFIIRKIVCSTNPDAVFMHSSFGGFLGRLALLGKNVKCFYLPHCISFMRQDISIIKRILFVLLEWVGALKTATYVACSNSEGDSIKKYIPFRSCVVVENAVNVNDWDFQGDWTSRKKQVITVGQIRLQKDPMRFARIVKDILAQRDDVEFVWVGDGEEESKQALINAGVKVLGWKTPEEVKQLLRSSRYYLSTALWEGMPVSPIESMLSGCVAVLSNCAGNIDIVETGTTGCVFKDEEQAVEKLTSLFDNEHLASSLAEAGRIHCAKQYAVERYVQEMNLLIKV
ncbi:MAG: glycosyltransferase involved in cell wall biosynthesis [Marivirga sp.]|jgi:glycosyltransferase involved in cell wall biosynthesis